MRTKK